MTTMLTPQEYAKHIGFPAGEYARSLEATVDALARFARAVDGMQTMADEDEYKAARKALVDAGWLT